MEGNSGIVQNNEISQEEHEKIKQIRDIVEKQDPTSKVYVLMHNVQVTVSCSS